jgi:N-acetylmuramic acid 6-phosphate etherase
MTRHQEAYSEPLFLGIECGASRTSAVIAQDEPTIFWQGKFRPANLRFLSDPQLARHFQAMASALPRPAAIAIGMAGARTEADRERIRRAARKVWPGIPCYATNDLETALKATEEFPTGSPSGSKAPGFSHASRITHPPSEHHASARVLVLSGTGSCCFGKTWDGKRTAKVGGWGHILGDKGSGFEIGLRALKALVYYYDRDGEWDDLGRRILRKLELNEPDDLIGWVQKAAKDDVAALAVEVFTASSRRDKIASDILAGAAESLAADAVSCAQRLVKPGTPVQFVLAGGVLLNQPHFARRVAALLRKSWPNSVAAPLQRESVWGAVELAKREFQKAGAKAQPSLNSSAGPDQRGARLGRSRSSDQYFPSLESLQDSPTEQPNPRSMKLDTLSVAEAIALMLSEDLKIAPAILAERKKIERAVKFIARAFKHGGRLYYVGAGTSGRLGVLDASECPPTFGVPADLVQGIIAGGQRALWESVEGAEDDSGAGARAIQFHGVNPRDVVVGIAAGGRTPFVWGALWEAKQRGAKTILLCFNPRLEIPRRNRPDLVIAPNVGPEILTGSTRLKSGTATKLVLNIFTTLAMVRTGKVIGNLMVDLNPANLKLRDRAVRILGELSGVDPATARRALEKSDWAVKEAWRRLRRP